MRRVLCFVWGKRAFSLLLSNIGFGGRKTKMEKQPVKLKAVVYALSPFQQKIMTGLFRDIPGKIHHKVSENWISTILLLAPVIGTYSGGIMFWADSTGSKYIYSKLDEWSKAYGGFFKPCDFLAERGSKGAPLSAPLEQARSRL